MVAADTVGVAFLGVTTRLSAVHRVLDSWSDCLGHRLVLKSMDLPLKSDATAYCKFVAEVRNRRDNFSGAVITSHKVGVYEAAANLIDIVTPTARRLGEIGMLYWRQDKLVGDASDSFAILQVAHRLLKTTESWQKGARSVVILGGGGAGVALADSMIQARDLGCRKVTITEIDPTRLSALRSKIVNWIPPVPVHAVLVEDYADALVASAGEGSLVANASGLGKDRPGSPISRIAVFPEGVFVWEFNYRFIAQAYPTFWDIALRQAESRNLIVEDGWDYFVWNWLGMLSNIVNLAPETSYECFREVANAVRYKSIS